MENEKNISRDAGESQREKELREQMRSLDDEILTLLVRKLVLRQELTEESMKQFGDMIAPGTTVYGETGQASESRSEKILRKYRDALEHRREPVQDPRVVYQGEPGAYSELAAIDFFGEGVRTEGKRTFEDAFRALRSGEADYAVLPIENSSTGAIRQVYDLLVQYECFMVGETTVSVSHSLMALPGVGLEDIDTVYSHEQGLFQCERFLEQYPHWRQVAKDDTAGSAKLIAETGNRHAAAICSARSAKIYGLHILAEGINHNSVNTTRFIVVSPQMELREGSDKICISFTTAHESGSLHEVLTIFSAYGLNMVRLESRPVLGRNWEYMFFVEFTGSLPELDDVMEELTHATYDMRVFGNFRTNL